MKQHILQKIVSKIATDLDQLAYDFDTYEYRDCCDDRETGYQMAVDALNDTSKEAFDIQMYLRMIINECDSDDRSDKENRKSAKKLMRRIQNLNKLRAVLA